LAHGEALVTLGDLGVDELDQADLPGLVKEGGDIAEASTTRRKFVRGSAGTE
jgi:hypothetical protein